MKTFRSRTGHAIEGGGEDVLAGVLLHVLEPAGPVDRTVHGAGLELTLHDVQDGVIATLDHVDDPGGAKTTGVERLAARGWIKRSAVEYNRRPAVV